VIKESVDVNDKPDGEGDDDGEGAGDDPVS